RSIPFISSPRLSGGNGRATCSFHCFAISSICFILRYISRRSESNLQPFPYKGIALPVELRRQKLALRMTFETNKIEHQLLVIDYRLTTTQKIQTYESADLWDFWDILAGDSNVVCISISDAYLQNQNGWDSDAAVCRDNRNLPMRAFQVVTKTRRQLC